MGKQLLFVVSITDGQQRSALNAVSSLNKSLIRKGLPPVQSVMKNTTASRISSGEGHYSVRRWSMLIFGKTPCIDGWSINCVIEKSPEGDIEIFRFGKATVDHNNTFLSKSILCDICNEKRDRRKGYLVSKDGVTKSIGENCMNSFFSFKPIKTIYLLQNLSRTIKELKEISSSRTSSPASLSYIPIKPFLQYVLCLVELRGYVPKSHGGRTTGSEAANWYLRHGIPDKTPGDISTHSGSLDKRIYHLKEEQSLNIINWARHLNKKDSYSSNIKQICEDGWVYITHVNLAASIYEAYEKHLSRERQSEQIIGQGLDATHSKFEIIEKNLRCARIAKVETKYGTRFLHYLYDTDGTEYGLFKSRPILTKGTYYSVHAMIYGNSKNDKDGVKRMNILRKVKDLSECNTTTK